MNQIALVIAACALGETRLAAEILVPLCGFIIQIQKLPERVLLFYLLPAIIHILLEGNRAEHAVMLLAAGRAHRSYPRAWLDQLPFMCKTEAQLGAVLTTAQYKKAEIQGQQTSFGALTPQLLPIFHALFTS
jgi:hypothetical protein